MAAYGLKMKSFQTMALLLAYANASSTDVVTIINVFFDSASGQFVIAYKAS